MIWTLLMSGVLARNVFVNLIVGQIADALAEYHVSHVPSAAASSIVNDLIGSYVDAPPISSELGKIVNQVERDLLGNLGNLGRGISLDPNTVASILEDYIPAFGSFSHAPEFAPFKAAVKTHKPSFDISRLVADVEAPGNNGNAAIASLVDILQSLDRNPHGQRAMSLITEVYDEHNAGLALGLPSISNLLHLI